MYLKLPLLNLQFFYRGDVGFSPQFVKAAPSEALVHDPHPPKERIFTGYV